MTVQVVVALQEVGNRLSLSPLFMMKILLMETLANWDVWQTSLDNPDFAEHANLCGASGLSVKKKDELDGAISEALAHGGPSLVEIHFDVELV